VQTVILMADLRESSPSRERALSLYRALEEHPGTNPYFYAFHDSREELKPYRTTDSIHLTKDAIVVMFREFREFYKIDSTNLVVYVASEPKIEQFMTFVLPRVDRVVAYDYHSAYFLCAALRQIGLQTPVHRIPLWIDATSLPKHAIASNGPLSIGIRGNDPIIYGLIRDGADHKVTISGSGPSAHGWILTDKINIADHDVYAHFDGSSECVQVAIASGVIPVVPNKSPYNEWIVNGLNGFIVSTERDLVEAVRLLANKEQLRIYQEILWRSAQNISSAAWVDMFLGAMNGDVENLNQDGLFKPFEPSNRKWIVPKIALEAGNRIPIPRNYDTDAFKTVNLSDIEDVMKFFVTQRFREVYVFGWDYGDTGDREKLERTSALVRSMGKRAMDIFWVSDQEVPKEWAQVFSRMTRLSVRDGLNRVSAQ
jgi:hypothetical protein